MSVITHEPSVGGTTIALRIVTESGDEIDYRSARGLTIETSPLGFAVPSGLQRDLSARGMDRPARQNADRQARTRERAL